MSTDVVQKTNLLLDHTAGLRAFILDVDLESLKQTTVVDWDSGLLLRFSDKLAKILTDLQWVKPTNTGALHFDNQGKAFLGKLLLDLDRDLKQGLLFNERYRLERRMVSGKNSITFLAKDTRLDRPMVLKFFRPGRGEGIIENVAKLSKVRGEPILVNPTDVLNHVVWDAHNTQVRLDVLVFPFVEGVTFHEYLLAEKNSNPAVVQAFIEQVCFALNSLQLAGFHHGDVHPNNVMVTSELGGTLAFRLIDVSYGADKPSDYEYPHDDFQGFKFILRLALDDVQRRLGRTSLRRHLGARLYTLVEFVLGAEKLSFAEILGEATRGLRFSAFNKRKEDFLRIKFKPPRDFGILRYEEIADPDLAIRFFHPYPELFARLREFGSAILFGHRGTGKSTYLAALTFFPQAKHPIVNHCETFGILFSCRQGEFRKFSNRHLDVTKRNRLLIKDILVNKIIRKTLNSLAAGVAKDVIRRPASIQPMAGVLSKLQHAFGLTVTHQQSELDSLHATVLQAEINAIDRLFAGETIVQPSALLDESSLTEFFQAVREVFSDLNQARFYVLFDDAGEPNVTRDMQALICDLMASTNSVYCIKLSAEKTTFELATSDGKPIERGHDFKSFTISDYLYLAAGISMERRTVEAYFRELVAMRLDVCKYPTTDIREYLGNEIVKVTDLVKRLAGKDKLRPEYCGWDMVWQIADRTPRHLIEMISAIFDAAKVTQRSPRQLIARQVQSRQIVGFSGGKLRGLMTMPGTVRISGNPIALGKRLYEFAASFGRLSRFYLRNSGTVAVGESEERRFDEKLAIEIDNTLSLSAEAQSMLNELIRFAVLDDEQMPRTRDDGTRKPIYIFNRVYCPILGISFRRDSHLRLASQRFEKLLICPTEFVRSDKRLLKIGNPEIQNEDDLFHKRDLS